MKGKVVALVVAGSLVFGLGACKKKEEAAPVGQAPAGPAVMMPPQAPEIMVPDSVKVMWSAVKMTIEDKSKKSSQDVTVKLGSDYRIPGSTMTVKVGDFLPDFKMEGSVITSASDQLNNPAVRVVVFDGDKEIFKGWLYSKFPAIHPFQHERYGLTLKDGVKGKG
ncbi:MAG: DUF2155 domain-containing protein [Thermodesulfovibrionales bacterium]|nr:DUF2155 domain-containing protein [Thermodesulfovibrionales bacterium]